MVRAAKATGNGSCLFPPGINSVEEMTWDLCLAIEHALRICSWQENLMPEDMPPNWMLPFEDQLKIHFEEVDRRREEKYGTGSGDVESSDMMSNDLSSGFR